MHIAVGIRHKASMATRLMGCFEDLGFFLNEFKASLRSNPSSAYAMFPDDYELVSVPVDFNSTNNGSEIVQIPNFKHEE